MLASLSSLILMSCFQWGPWQHQFLPSNKTCGCLFKTLPFGAYLSLPFIAVVSPTSYFFLNLFFLPVSSLFSICFFWNFPFSEGFTDHSHSFLPQCSTSRLLVLTPVISKPGFAKTGWAKLSACYFTISGCLWTAANNSTSITAQPAVKHFSSYPWELELHIKNHVVKAPDDLNASSKPCKYIKLSHISCT